MLSTFQLPCEEHASHLLLHPRPSSFVEIRRETEYPIIGINNNLLYVIRIIDY